MDVFVHGAQCVSTGELYRTTIPVLTHWALFRRFKNDQFLPVYGIHRLPNYRVPLNGCIKASLTKLSHPVGMLFALHPSRRDATCHHIVAFLRNAFTIHTSPSLPKFAIKNTSPTQLQTSEVFATVYVTMRTPNTEPGLTSIIPSGIVGKRILCKVRC